MQKGTKIHFYFLMCSVMSEFDVGTHFFHATSIFDSKLFVTTKISRLNPQTEHKHKTSNCIIAENGRGRFMIELKFIKKCF